MYVCMWIFIAQPLQPKQSRSPVYIHSDY